MNVFDDSDEFAEALLALIELPLCDDSPRVKFVDVACSLSLEDWHAIRDLLRMEFLPSALIIHRAQFEALVRSIWLSYAPSDTEVS